MQNRPQIQLSLIALGLLGVISIISVLVVPVFREKLNRQFMLGARNQAFLTEYVAGMATVKSLQMEPDIDKKYGDLLGPVHNQAVSIMPYAKSAE